MAPRLDPSFINFPLLLPRSTRAWISAGERTKSDHIFLKSLFIFGFKEDCLECESEGPEPDTRRRIKVFPLNGLIGSFYYSYSIIYQHLYYLYLNICIERVNIEICSLNFKHLLYKPIF